MEHKLPHLLAQRIHAIALGYEDINDHDKLRLDPLLAPTYHQCLEEHLGKEKYEELRKKADAGKLKQVTLPDDLQYKAYAELRYRTKDTWNRKHRVIGKAAITSGKITPRFIVTDLTGEEQGIAGDATYLSGQALYENCYCARGDMEPSGTRETACEAVSRMILDRLQSLGETFEALLKRTNFLRRGSDSSIGSATLMDPKVRIFPYFDNPPIGFL